MKCRSRASWNTKRRGSGARPTPSTYATAFAFCMSTDASTSRGGVLRSGSAPFRGAARPLSFAAAGAARSPRPARTASVENARIIWRPGTRAIRLVVVLRAEVRDQLLAAQVAERVLQLHQLDEEI